MKSDTVPDYLTEIFKNQQFNPSERLLISNIRNVVLGADPMVDERSGNIMKNSHALIYEQEGVFKYGLARSKTYFTFHSMVMYAYPELKASLAGKSDFFKMQKGCINFPLNEDFPLKTFSEWIEASARMDFSPVMARYK